REMPEVRAPSDPARSLRYPRRGRRLWSSAKHFRRARARSLPVDRSHASIDAWKKSDQALRHAMTERDAPVDMSSRDRFSRRADRETILVDRERGQSFGRSAPCADVVVDHDRTMRRFVEPGDLDAAVGFRIEIALRANRRRSIVLR